MKYSELFNLLLIIQTAITTDIIKFEYKKFEKNCNGGYSDIDSYIKDETKKAMELISSTKISLNYLEDSLVKKYVENFDKHNNERYKLVKKFICDYITILKKGLSLHDYELEDFVETLKKFKIESKFILNQMLMDIIKSFQAQELNVEQIILINFGKILKAYHTATMSVLQLFHEKNLSNEDYILTTIRDLRYQFNNDFYKISDKDIEDLKTFNIKLFLSFDNIKSLFRNLFAY